MFLSKLDPIYFFAAFSVGILVSYLTTPRPDIIVQHPNPHNAGEVVYKDKSDTCYKYKADKVECPADEELIKPQPIQEGFEQKKKSNY
jgi:hypothetical protein